MYLKTVWDLLKHLKKKDFYCYLPAVIYYLEHELNCKVQLLFTVVQRHSLILLFTALKTFLVSHYEADFSDFK